MTENEIIKLWNKGITKLTLAKIYQRRYNQNVEIIRFDMKNRNVKFITYKEALNKVERIILEYIKKYN